MQHEYHVVCEWVDERGRGTVSYDSYSRNHTVAFDSGQLLECSADSAFRGDLRANPEELLLASIASCHMLWFLHLAADSGVVVVRYRDTAEAQLDMKASPQRITRASLCPVVDCDEPVDSQRLASLHHEAHRRCFIANSVNFPIDIKQPDGRALSEFDSVEDY